MNKVLEKLKSIKHIEIILAAVAVAVMIFILRLSRSRKTKTNTIIAKALRLSFRRRFGCLPETSAKLSSIGSPALNL